MKKRRKFELLLTDLRRLVLDDPAQADRNFALSLAVWNLSDFNRELLRDAVKSRQMLEFGRLLRASDAQGRQLAEERFLENLACLAGQCCDLLEEAEFPRAPGFPAIHEAPPELQQPLLVLRELHDFALACFTFKRPRDSLGGRRRALAFDILGQVGFVVDLPEVVRMARQALRKAQSVESRQAAEFLEEYFAERSLSPDDEMMEDLLSLAEKTDSRSTAFRALDTLVETGAISEFEAMDRMDDWKSKRR